MTPTDATTHALADLESTADALEAADLMLAAHSIRRAVRTLRAELSPAVVLDGVRRSIHENVRHAWGIDGQEDDGDPEVVGERIDPSVFVLPRCGALMTGGHACRLGRGHVGSHEWWSW